MSSYVSVEWDISPRKLTHRTLIPQSDITDCETEEDVRDLIRECIQADIEQLEADYGNDAIAKALELWREMKAEELAEQAKG